MEIAIAIVVIVGLIGLMLDIYERMVRWWHKGEKEMKEILESYKAGAQFADELENRVEDRLKKHGINHNG